MLHDEGDLSLCVGSFSPGGLNIEENQQFPAGRLFPEEMEGQYAGGVFMVQPLFIENRSLGYFIHNVPFYDGVILEELRSTVSNALKGIFLFEEADRAKQIAEQAERAKSEFFAAIGNNLYDPFSELIDAIDAVKGGLAGGLSGKGPAAMPADIQERLSGLRSLAEQRQERTNHLLDLSLSQIDEPSFKTGPFNITDMLEGLAGKTPDAAADAKLQNKKNLPILFIGIDGDLFPLWTDAGRRFHIFSAAELADATASGQRSAAPPSLIVIGGIDGGAIKTIEAVRRHPATAMTPLIAVPETISEAGDVEALCRCPRVVLCHRSVAKLGEFSGRVRAIAAGDNILPLYTGALVKRALLYFEKHAESHISRWKLADSVNVSEDYLTRIFHREMGCSLWEYLSQYRVCLASDLLIPTGDTISEIAARTGFQDQAYFCRVFKKIYGKAPGQIRNAKGY
jgi:AraC-like DNA-binding protein